MNYIYYVDGKKYTTDNEDDIPWLDISSPDEEIPAYENLETGEKLWCKKGWQFHRLTGPARIWPDGSYSFRLNDKLYENIQDWLKDHPNQDETFKKEMIERWG
jgi:hypothetical protein